MELGSLPGLGRPQAAPVLGGLSPARIRDDADWTARTHVPGRGIREAASDTWSGDQSRGASRKAGPFLSGIASQKFGRHVPANSSPVPYPRPDLPMICITCLARIRLEREANRRQLHQEKLSISMPLWMGLYRIFSAVVTRLPFFSRIVPPFSRVNASLIALLRPSSTACPTAR